MNKKILVVAAHPDDEILGCGGTILRHVEEKDRVQVLILSEGVTSRDESRDTELRQDELSQLHQAAQNAANFMGVEKISVCNFPDNRMDSVALLDVVKRIEKKVAEFQPDTIYTHHVGDVNVDHKITHEAVVTACRPLPNTSVKDIFFFETLSCSEWQMMTPDNIFCPNVFVDIGNYIDKKIEALHYYESEMREYPHSRSYEAIRILAQQRGFSVGSYYAEAFMCGRIIRSNQVCNNCNSIGGV